MGFFSDLGKSIMQGIGDGASQDASSANHNTQPCPECGTRMPDDGWDGQRYECPNHCEGGVFFMIDGELLTPDQRRERGPSRRCQNCEASLSGGRSGLPYEDGSTPYAFIMCPSCGSENIIDGMGGD